MSSCGISAPTSWTPCSATGWASTPGSRTHPGFRFVGPQYSLDEGIGIAVRKEDVEFRQDLNAALAATLTDGAYEKINGKYFPFSIYWSGV